jgi:16S rRNA (cytidine1402-2'-O)-methyltransferase
MKGTLYLIPNTLGNPDTTNTIPAVITERINTIQVYIVENLRNARRYLKSLNREIDINSLSFYELNEHTPEAEIPAFLDQAMQGADVGVLSEAGVPGVADPGAAVVRIAHEKGIRVVPLTGPSSILLSLMASGLNGQAFTFHGYLPVKRPERIRKIREIEQVCLRKGETQIFMEAPYRNDGLLRDILEVCTFNTSLCVAADLTMDTEFVQTRPVGEWKKSKPALHKRPVIFLLGR